MKRLAIAFALGGFALGTALLAWSGLGRVSAAALSVGWGGFFLLLLWQGVLFVVLGAAWACLAFPRVRLGLAVRARMLRDAAANCLPLSSIGGFVLGARAMQLGGQSWPAAAGSTIVDVTAEFIAQIGFVAFGLAILASRLPRAGLVVPLAAGLVLAALASVLLIRAQRGAGRLLDILGRHLAGRGFGATGPGLDELQAELARLHARPARLVAAILLHLLGWGLAGGAAWIAYRLLGAAVTLADALAIEALLHVVLTAAFLVPGGLGVQEAGYAALGALFGVPPDLSLGVSLLKRARDLAIGLPVLLAWQAMEARRMAVRRTGWAQSRP